jgi:hypothetical protein
MEGFVADWTDQAGVSPSEAAADTADLSITELRVSVHYSKGHGIERDPRGRLYVGLNVGLLYNDAQKVLRWLELRSSNLAVGEVIESRHL